MKKFKIKLQFELLMCGWITTVWNDILQFSWNVHLTKKKNIFKKKRKKEAIYLKLVSPIFTSNDSS